MTKRRASPWDKIIQETFPEYHIDSVVFSKIRSLMELAWTKGWNKADQSPRLPEGMGR